MAETHLVDGQAIYAMGGDVWWHQRDHRDLVVV